MEVVSGFLLSIADVFGIKWIREEKNKFKKAAKAVAFLICGIILVMIFFVFSYS